MKRTTVAIAALAACVAVVSTRPVVAQHQGTAVFRLVEATVADVQHALQTRLITSEQLVRMYLARIAAYDDAGPGVNAFIYVNPNAVAEARQLDRLRHPGRARRPLDGVPVALKDIIDTADMPTTGG
ncbi:MAG: amidase family protein, partial [Vicinamibacterales bacterium]